MQAEQTSSPISGEPKEKWYIPFFTIWTGQSFSLLGSQLVQFALIWWLTKTTGSATVLAVASLIGLLPQVFLGPLAGAVVDRWNRRVIMIAADSLIALSTLILALLFYTGSVLVWQVYLLMFLRSAAGAFHWPAMAASTSLMVPRQHHARIQGFNQMLGGGINIIAAPLGALLLELLPMQGVLVVDIGTAAIAVLPLLFIRVPEPQRSQQAQAGTEKTSVGQDFRAGLRYIWEWPGAIWLMGMAMFINMLLIPAFSLMPLLVTKHFGGQAIHLATLESASGVGIVIGGLILGVWGGFRRRIYTSLLGLFLLGIGSLAVGFTPASAFSIAVGSMFVLGFANPLTNGPVLAIIQSTVEPDMQGRVLTLLGSAAAAVSPLGLIIAGPIADSFGVRTWFIAGGFLTLLMGLAAVFIPSLLHIEDGRPHKQEPVQGQVQAVSSSAD